MRIQVNGEVLDVDDSLSLPQLIVKLNLKPEQIAVELNQRVIRRSDWESVALAADDKIEIVHFVGGG